MLTPLVISLALPLQAGGTAAAPVTPHEHSPVTVRLSDSTYARGAHARAYVRLRDTAYLLVLHVNGDGRIRVLFPLRPGDETLVPGGRFYELPGPDDREAIAVDERAGTGTVLAARSASPFSSDRLARGDEWDYADALLFQPTGGDPLAALLDIAERLAAGHRLDVDVTTYVVTPALAGTDPTPDSGFRYSSDPSIRAETMSAEPSAPALSVSAVCSNSYVAERSFCGSVLINPTFIESVPEPPPSPAYYPYYDPYLYDPWLFLPVIVIERPAPPALPPAAKAIVLRPRPPRSRVLTARPRSAPLVIPGRVRVPTVGPRLRTPAAAELPRLGPARPPAPIPRPAPVVWTRSRRRSPAVEPAPVREAGVVLPAPSRNHQPATATTRVNPRSDVRLPVLRSPMARIPANISPPAGRTAVVAARPSTASPAAPARPATASSVATRPTARAFPHPIRIVRRRTP